MSGEAMRARRRRARRLRRCRRRGHVPASWWCRRCGRWLGPWAPLCLTALALAGCSVRERVDPNAVCRGRGGVSRVDRVIGDGAQNLVVCRDGHARVVDHVR